MQYIKKKITNNAIFLVTFPWSCMVYILLSLYYTCNFLKKNKIIVTNFSAKLPIYYTCLFTKLIILIFPWDDNFAYLNFYFFDNIKVK